MTASPQEGRMQALVDEVESVSPGSSAGKDYNSVWHLFWDQQGIADGTFNERMLAWINDDLGEAYELLVAAQQAYAEAYGYYDWDSLLTITVGGAASLLAGETDGVGLDFTYHQGRAGDARVKDTVTEENVFSGEPYNLLPYSSPTVKVCRQADGTWKHGAHNLYTDDSEDLSGFAKAFCSSAEGGDLGPGLGTVQTVTESSAAASPHWLEDTNIFTAVPNVQYKFKVWAKTNGRNLIARFGGAGFDTQAVVADLTNGVISDTNGTPDDSGIEDLGDGWYVFFVTATADSAAVVDAEMLMCDGTTYASRIYDGDGSSGVFIAAVQILRTPAVETYRKSTNAAAYQLPYEWNAAGESIGIIPETASSNGTIYCRDFVNSSNVGASNISRALTATGIDGEANSATTLTATSDGGFIYRYNLPGSPGSTVTLSAFMRRRTGSGAVYLAAGHYGLHAIGDETVTGSDLVSNGTFDTDLTDWTEVGGGGSSTTQQNSGVGEMTRDGSNNIGLRQTLTTTIGKFYRVSFDMTIPSGSGNLRVGPNTSGGADFTTEGSHEAVFYANTTSMNLTFWNSSGTNTIAIDNVVVQEVDNYDPEVTLTSEWQRFDIQVAKGSFGAVMFQLATNGDQVDIDFVQTETGTRPSTPILTGAATVARAGDIIGLDLSASTSLPDMTTGGDIISFYAQYYGAAASNGAAWQIDDNSNGDRLTEYCPATTTSQLLSQNSTGDNGSQEFTSLAEGGLRTTAGRLKEDDLAYSMFGETQVTDNTMDLFGDALINLRIGNDFNGGNELNRHILKLAFVPREWGNALLETKVGN